MHQARLHLASVALIAAAFLAAGCSSLTPQEERAQFLEGLGGMASASALMMAMECSREGEPILRDANPNWDPRLAQEEVRTQFRDLEWIREVAPRFFGSQSPADFVFAEYPDGMDLGEGPLGWDKCPTIRSAVSNYQWGDAPPASE